MATSGYIRVSTTEQATSGDSLETRRIQVLGYCLIKGWELDEVFVESGVSGSDPLADRPEGEGLLARAQKGDSIVTAKSDRMFRSASDTLGTHEDIRERLHDRLEFARCAGAC